MPIINIFKRKTPHWEALKNFLIKDCYIPFNQLNAIENATDSIMKTVDAGGAGSIVAVKGIREEDRFILQMAIAAKSADAKNCTFILANGNETGLNDALNQWKPKNCKITIGSAPVSKSKKYRVCVNLYDHTEDILSTDGNVYIFDALKIRTGISPIIINI